MKVYFTNKSLIDSFNRIRNKYDITQYRIAKLAELDNHTVRDIINYNTNPLSLTYIKMFFGLYQAICDSLKVDATFAAYILNVVSNYYYFGSKKLSKITCLDEALINAVIEGVQVCKNITMQIFLGCLSYIENNDDLNSIIIDDLVLGLLHFISNNIKIKTILKSGLCTKLVLDIFKEQYNITPHKISTIISVDHKSLDRLRELSLPTLKTQTKLYSYVYNKLNWFGNINDRCKVAETFLARVVFYYYITTDSRTIYNLTLEDKLKYIDILVKGYGFDKLIAYNSLNLDLNDYYVYKLNF